jgi:outer membrane lipoprotein-sorting protein
MQMDNEPIEQNKPTKSNRKMRILTILIALVVIVIIIFAIVNYSSFFGTSPKSGGNTLGSGEDISSILAKSNNIGSWYCEANMTSAFNGTLNPTTVTAKYWVKEPYAKLEETNGAITQTMITRPDGVYTYNQSNGTYIKMSNANPLSPTNFNDFLNQVKKNKDYQVLGKETINGKTSTIISYTNTSMGMTFNTKMWIWNEKGLPLKIEMTTPYGSLIATITMVFNNFSFVEIPDSTFNVS